MYISALVFFTLTTFSIFSAKSSLIIPREAKNFANRR
ncbi:hypothetical protein [Sulfolobus spindle-shaped virus]|nr:hypothetical protein [Sulfolobus spindle-shaped virus]